MTHFLAQQGRVKLIWHREETRCGLSHAVRSLAVNVHTVLSLIHLDPKVLAISAKAISGGLKGRSLKWYRLEIKLAWKASCWETANCTGEDPQSCCGLGEFYAGVQEQTPMIPSLAWVFGVHSIPYTFTSKGTCWNITWAPQPGVFT